MAFVSTYNLLVVMNSYYVRNVLKLPISRPCEYVLWVVISAFVANRWTICFKQEALVLLLDVSPSMHNILQEVEKVCSMLVQKKVPISLCECFFAIYSLAFCYMLSFLLIVGRIDYRGRIVRRYC